MKQVQVKLLLFAVLVLFSAVADEHHHDHHEDHEHHHVEVDGRHFRPHHGLFHKVKKACYRDYKQFCDDIDDPKSQEASQCIFDHFDELSSRCADVISQHPMVACIADSRALCREEDEHHHKHHHRFHDFLERPREDIAQCLLNSYDDLTDACSSYISTTPAYKCQDIARDSCAGVPPRHIFYCVLGAVNNIEEDSECKSAMLGEVSNDPEGEDSDEGEMSDDDASIDVPDSDADENADEEEVHTDTQSLTKDSTLSFREHREEDDERHGHDRDHDHRGNHGKRRRHHHKRRHHDDDDDDRDDEGDEDTDDVDTHDDDEHAEPEEEEECDDEESGVSNPGDYYGFEDEDEYYDHYHHHHHFLGFVFMVLCVVGVVKGIKYYKRRRRQGEAEVSQREFGYEPLLDENDLETNSAPASTMPNVKTEAYVYGN